MSEINPKFRYLNNLQDLFTCSRYLSYTRSFGCWINDPLYTFLGRCLLELIAEVDMCM